MSRVQLAVSVVKLVQAAEQARDRIDDLVQENQVLRTEVEHLRAERKKLIRRLFRERY